MKFKTREEFTEWVKAKRIVNAKALEVAQAEEDMIKIEDLIIGKTYKGEGRNFQEGEWRGDGFYGQRYKFGDIFEDRELHWDADPRYGTFKPKQLVK